MHASMGKIGKEKTDKTSGQNPRSSGRRYLNRDLVNKDDDIGMRHLQTSQASVDCSTRKLHNSDIDLVHFIEGGGGSELAKIPLQTTHSRPMSNQAFSREASHNPEGLSTNRARVPKSSNVSAGADA
jgi:hypothetical protein